MVNSPCMYRHAVLTNSNTMLINGHSMGLQWILDRFSEGYTQILKSGSNYKVANI